MVNLIKRDLAQKYFFNPLTVFNAVIMAKNRSEFGHEKLIEGLKQLI